MSAGRDFGRGARCLVVGMLGCVWHLAAGEVHAADAPAYELRSAFDPPGGAGPLAVLPDGRLLLLVGDNLRAETAVGSRVFASLGTLSGADFPSFGAAFLKVSPDGTKIALGNNGGASFANYEVGVFSLSDLTGTWFAAGHYDAAWIDNTQLALTAGDFVGPSVVTVLDTTSPVPASPINITIIANIGGASGGLAFDQDGNLFTGNGFTLFGPSGTGVVKAFDEASWQAALVGGPPLDFETGGVLVVDVLSAWPLGFDSAGNLLVGGGDFEVADDFDFAAVVSVKAVAAALLGGGPADVGDPQQVLRLDPDATNDFNFYSPLFNPITGELYVRDGRVHVYCDPIVVPAASAWSLAAIVLLMLCGGTVLVRRNGAGGTA